MIGSVIISFFLLFVMNSFYKYKSGKNEIHFTLFSLHSSKFILYLLHILHAAISYFDSVNIIFLICYFFDTRILIPLALEVACFVTRYLLEVVPRIDLQSKLNNQTVKCIVGTSKTLDKFKSIPIVDIKVGDYIILAEGETVPADILLQDTKEEKLYIDESNFTDGDTLSIKKAADYDLDDYGVRDSSHSSLNMLYRGTVLVEGVPWTMFERCAKGRVVRIGNDCKLYSSINREIVFPNVPAKTRDMFMFLFLISFIVSIFKRNSFFLIMFSVTPLTRGWPSFFPSRLFSPRVRIKSLEYEKIYEVQSNVPPTEYLLASIMFRNEKQNLFRDQGIEITFVSPEWVIYTWEDTEWAIKRFYKHEIGYTHVTYESAVRKENMDLGDTDREKHDLYFGPAKNVSSFLYDTFQEAFVTENFNFIGCDVTGYVTKHGWVLCGYKEKIKKKEGDYPVIYVTGDGNLRKIQQELEIEAMTIPPIQDIKIGKHNGELFIDVDGKCHINLDAGDVLFYGASPEVKRNLVKRFQDEGYGVGFEGENCSDLCANSEITGDMARSHPPVFKDFFNMAFIFCVFLLSVYADLIIRIHPLYIYIPGVFIDMLTFGLGDGSEIILMAISLGVLCAKVLLFPSFMGKAFDVILGGIGVGMLLLNRMG